MFQLSNMVPVPGILQQEVCEIISENAPIILEQAQVDLMNNIHVLLTTNLLNTPLYMAQPTRTKLQPPVVNSFHTGRSLGWASGQPGQRATTSSPSTHVTRATRISTSKTPWRRNPTTPRSLQTGNPSKQVSQPHQYWR